MVSARRRPRDLMDCHLSFDQAVPPDTGCADRQPVLFASAEIQAAIYACLENGIGIDELLAGSELGVADVLTDKRVSAVQCRIIHDQARRLATALVDVAIGRRLGVAAFGIAGFAIMSAPGPAEAIALLRRFWPLFNMRFVLVASATSAGLRVDFHSPDGEKGPAPDIASVRLEIAKIVALLRDILGEGFVPLEIGIDMVDGEHADLAAFARIPMTPAARPYILLGSDAVRWTPSQANLPAHRASVSACEGIMGFLQKEPDVVRAVRQQLSGLQGGAPSPRAIATALNMSERTMRRRLQAYNTSYNRLLSEVRLKLAERFLDEGAMSTDLIAEQLGYTEATNFRHAFRRWTGSSPRRYQVKGQGGAAGVAASQQA